MRELTDFNANLSGYSMYLTARWIHKRQKLKHYSGKQEDHLVGSQMPD